MSRRTTAIAAALSLLALGSSVITAYANPLANNSFNSGVDKYEQGDFQGAITDFSKAIEINPQDASAFLNRGVAKTKLGDYPGSIADFTKALEINPQYANALHNRGAAKAALGDYQGAIADYNKAIEVDPKDAVA